MITVDTPKHPKACLTVFPALSLGLTRICASFKVFESSDPFPPNSLPQSNTCANSKAFICLRRKFGIACIHVVSLKFILYSISWYLESWGLCRIYYLWGILKLLQMLQSVTGPPAAKRRILCESIWKQMQVRGFFSYTFEHAWKKVPQLVHNFKILRCLTMSHDVSQFHIPLLRSLAVTCCHMLSLAVWAPSLSTCSAGIRFGLSGQCLQTRIS